MLRVAPACEIVLGEVVGLFVRSDALDPSSLHIDQQAMDVLGRMGGHTYARTREQFDIRTQSEEEWARRASAPAEA